MKLVSPCLYIVTKHPQQVAMCTSFVTSTPNCVCLMMGSVALTQIFF